jgi:hypothetical protein
MSPLKKHPSVHIKVDFAVVDAPFRWTSEDLHTKNLIKLVDYSFSWITFRG